jgi:hypothetical protein
MHLPRTARFARSACPLVLALAGALACGGCPEEDSGGCELDGDCPPGFVCLVRVCWQNPQDGESIDPGEEPPAQDDGGPPGDEPGPADDGPAEDEGGGGDEGQAQDDGAPAWSIEAGRSIGPATVSRSLANFTTLSQLQAELGESGSLVSGATYTMSFVGDRLWAVGIDVNDSKTFDAPDHIISIIAREGLNARTPNGLTLGSAQADVRGALGQPDHSDDVAPSATSEGGSVDEYFRYGLFVNYDPAGLVKALTVTRVYSAPAGSFDPAAGTLTYGGTTIYLGDGNSTGDAQAVHRGAVGEPDWPSSFEKEIDSGGSPVDVLFYVDSYRIQGLEFIGVDTVAGMFEKDRLVLVGLYPFYYGQAANGVRIGSPKSALDAAYGAPTIVSDPAWTGVLYLYTTGTRKLGVLYTDDGQSPSDTAVMLILNYQEG